MSNVKFIFINDSDEATLTGPSGEVATLPALNLQLPGRSNLLRTLTLTTQTVLGDMPETVFVDGFSIANHNFTTEGTVRLRTYDGVGQTGNLTYDSGNVIVSDPVAWGVFFWGFTPWGSPPDTGAGSLVFTLFFDIAACRSFQIDYEDATNPDLFIDIGRLFIGKTFAPTIGVDYGMSQSHMDSSKQTRTDGGTLRTEVGQVFKSLDMPMNFLNAADRDTLSTAARDLGLRKEFLVSAYPDADGLTFADYTFIGKFTQIPAAQNSFNTYFESTLSIEES